MEKTLCNIIRDWVSTNQKAFWKYEVSSFHITHKITILNLPNPSNTDIKISPDTRLLKDTQRTQLCNNIKKTCAKADTLNFSRIDVSADFKDGEVAIAIVKENGYRTFTGAVAHS